MYSPGRCGESHLGGGRSFGWLRSEKLKANDKSCYGLQGQATARVPRHIPNRHWVLKEGGGGGQSERAELQSSAPYPVLSFSCSFRSWWLHTSCPGTEARPSTGPETPRRSISRCYGRLLHTVCSMLLIYRQKREKQTKDGLDEAPVRAEMATVDESGRPRSRSCCQWSESRSGDVKACRCEAEAVWISLWCYSSLDCPTGGPVAQNMSLLHFFSFS